MPPESGARQDAVPEPRWDEHRAENGGGPYALTRMKKLTPYLDHGFLEIDNNSAERAMRCVALGRKNYLFVGSEGGGKSAANRSSCEIAEKSTARCILSGLLRFTIENEIDDTGADDGDRSTKTMTRSRSILNEDSRRAIRPPSFAICAVKFAR